MFEWMDKGITVVFDEGIKILGKLGTYLTKVHYRNITVIPLPSNSKRI